MPELRHVIRRLMIAASLALLPLAVLAQQIGEPTIILNQGEGGLDFADGTALLARARAQGRLAVIVGFDAGYVQVGTMSREAARSHDLQVERERDLILQQAGIHGTREYGGLPFFSLDATPEQLRRLLQTEGVTSIQEAASGFLDVSLNHTTQVIGAPRVWSEGFEGTGRTVAIIDSGVDTRHPALRRRIVGEYCASADPRICTQGSTAAGSGRPCAARLDGCGHGTHVAGIAAMQSSGTSGVAPEAGILAIQATRRNNRNCGHLTAPCVTWDERDVLAALSHVRDLSLAGTLDIASVNLSLGDPSRPFVGPCNSRYPNFAIAVGELTSLGIAVIAASGNGARRNTGDFPGCISDVIMVGATWAQARRPEGLPYYSNFGPAVEMLAPGQDIASIVPIGYTCAGPNGNRLCPLSGTSMAVPHVAGAFALLREAYPDASLQRLRTALLCTGVRIATRYTDEAGTNTETVRARPRINVGAALDWLNDSAARDCTTSTTLRTEPGSSSTGQEIALIATVTPAEEEPAPEGDVEFFDGETLLGTAPLETGGPVVQVAAGPDNTCAVLGSGQVFCWGSSGPAIGDGTFWPRLIPTAVYGVDDGIEVSIGYDHACALRSTGRVACWGFNTYGQLGDGTTTTRITQVAVQGLDDAIHIAAGEKHTCAIRRSGSVVCWGDNAVGQLGDGTTIDRLTPVAVQGVSNAIQIAVGRAHTCAVRRTGRIICWGNNAYGELGDGTPRPPGHAEPPTHGPVEVVGVRDAIQVAAGFAHTCALRTTGRIACWGRAGSGQLGNGDPGHYYVLTPVAVRGVRNAIQITAGTQHTCAVRSTGRIACWGGNGSGQLGDGTVIDRPTPVAVRGVRNATGIASGVSWWAGFHTCALRRTGEVSCWGLNDGRLGDGTTADSLTPVSVVRPWGNSYRAVFRDTFWRTGTHRFTAAYLGSADHAASVSTTIEHRVSLLP